jgi:hypothetical protein
LDLLSRLLWQLLDDWLWVQVSLWYRDSEFASVNGEEVDEEERAVKVTRGNLKCGLGLLEARRGRDDEKWRRGLEAAIAISEERKALRLDYQRGFYTIIYIRL